MKDFKDQFRKEAEEAFDKIPAVRAIVWVNILSWLGIVASIVVLIWGTWQDALKIFGTASVFALLSGGVYRYIKIYAKKELDKQISQLTGNDHRRSL